MREAKENVSTGEIVPAESAGAVGRVSLWIVRVRESVRRRRWMVWAFGSFFLGIVWWLGGRYHWLTRFRQELNAGLQVVADPSHLAEVLLGIGIVVVLALWWLPKLQAGRSQGIGSENRFDRENEARKTLAQIIAGVFVLAGLYSSVKTFDLQRQSADLQRQTEKLQQDGQITDRFTKAIDQLGALAPGGGLGKNGRPKINLEVRLGGIYALERIANDSPKDRWTIMEVLTAYVRENSPATDLVRSMQGLPHDTGVSPDVQTILTVVGRRDIRRDPEGRRIDLHGANLSGADLTRAHLEGAFLDGVNLNDAVLFEANLAKASLRQARLERADLISADLNQANLFRTNLGYAHLGKANLSDADLNEANFSNASLIGANLNYASLNLGKLTGADIKIAKLLGAELVGADLNMADLSGAELGGVHLDHAHLGKAILNRATLGGAFLVGADLRGASLYFGYLSEAELDGANLADSDLRGADLRTAHGLLTSQLVRTRGDTETKLPLNITPPTSWNNPAVPKHALLGK